jgi:hypothetical protein
MAASVHTKATGADFKNSINGQGLALQVSAVSATVSRDSTAQTTPASAGDAGSAPQLMTVTVIIAAGAAAGGVLVIAAAVALGLYTMRKSKRVQTQEGIAAGDGAGMKRTAVHGLHPAQVPQRMVPFAVA